MSRTLFYVFTILLFVVASLAVGIRGAENWAFYEMAVYYLCVAWIAQGVRDRYVEIGISSESA